MSRRQVRTVAELVEQIDRLRWHTKILEAGVQQLRAELDSVTGERNLCLALLGLSDEVAP